MRKPICKLCKKEFINKSHHVQMFCSYACSNSIPKKRNYGIDHPNWIGGRQVTTQGYIEVKAKNHFNSHRRGFILEHRLIMEKHIGRRLLRDEVVHHINHKKTDNRIENLELLTNSEHIRKYHGVKKGMENNSNAKSNTP